MSRGRWGGTRRGPDSHPPSPPPPRRAPGGRTPGAGSLGREGLGPAREGVAGVDLTADSSQGLWGWRALRLRPREAGGWSRQVEGRRMVLPCQPLGRRGGFSVTPDPTSHSDFTRTRGGLVQTHQGDGAEHQGKAGGLKPRPRAPPGRPPAPTGRPPVAGARQVRAKVRRPGPRGGPGGRSVPRRGVVPVVTGLLAFCNGPGAGRLRTQASCGDWALPVFSGAGLAAADVETGAAAAGVAPGRAARRPCPEGA